MTLTDERAPAGAHHHPGSRGCLGFQKLVEMRFTFLRVLAVGPVWRDGIIRIPGCCTSLWLPGTTLPAAPQLCRSVLLCTHFRHIRNHTTFTSVLLHRANHTTFTFVLLHRADDALLTTHALLLSAHMMQRMHPCAHHIGPKIRLQSHRCRAPVLKSLCVTVRMNVRNARHARAIPPVACC